MGQLITYLQVIAHNKTELKTRRGKSFYYGCSTRHDIMSGIIEKGDGLEARLAELESLQQDKVRELGQLIGDELRSYRCNS